MSLLWWANQLASDPLCLLLEEVGGEMKVRDQSPTHAPATPAPRSVLGRASLLIEYASALGASWARALCDATRFERRLVVGGFPGTIPEARSRVREFLRVELASLDLPPLEQSELTHVVDIAYARARREWLDASRQEKAMLRG